MGISRQREKPSAVPRGAKGEKVTAGKNVKAKQPFRRQDAQSSSDEDEDSIDEQDRRIRARMEAYDSDDEEGTSDGKEEGSELDDDDADNQVPSAQKGRRKDKLANSDFSESDYADEDELGSESFDEDAVSEEDEEKGSVSEEDSSEPEEESEDEEILAMKKLQQELADMPFEQIQAMRSSMGAKKFDALQRDLADIDKRKEEKAKDKPKKPKRENKNRPREMSSKRPVTRFREVVSVTKSRARDPRFDSLSGSFNKDLFEKSYSFLDDYRKAEMEQLHKELKKEKSEDRKREIQSVLSKMRQDERQKRMNEQKSALKRKQRQAEKEAVAQGKKPYYPKKSEMKLMERVSKYKEIAAQGQGKVDDYIAKRRKKNAAKDHRFVPYERR